jgi:hypothetical protein
MLHNKKFLIVYKILFGLLGLSAIATEIVTLVHRGTLVPANFFSFFTVESNVFAAVILLLSAMRIGRQPMAMIMLRGAATLYMVTTGIVFSVLLSGLESDVLTAVPWDNMVLHYIMPIAVFIDWWLDPPAKRISFRRSLIWLSYPLAYVVYSLIRGAAIDWYPYPFLNPATNGYAAIFITSLGITATILVLTWLLIRIRRRA